MTRPLAWITGAGGLIGNCLVQAATAAAPGWQARGLTREELDLTDEAAVRAAFERDRPALVIHCAAMSRSTDCQADPALARRVNVDMTGFLARLAGGIPFVFFSTDLVFDGREGNYEEAAAVNPLSVYAETKAVAEQEVLSNPGHTVVRTSLNGGTSPRGDRGFNEEIRRAFRAGRALRLFTDEFRCPIPAEVTARAVWELVGRDCPGLYHLAGAERLSRWQIGELLAHRWPELRPKVEAGSLRDYSGAPRPPDTSLNCERLQSLLSFRLPGLTRWLEDHPDVVF